MSPTPKPRPDPGVAPADAHIPLKPVWFHVLLTLAGGSAHGYAIRQDVEDRTAGAIRLWPTTLYGTLARLQAARLIEESDQQGPDDDVPRRFYHLTPLGQQVLALETDRLAALVREARQKTRRPREV
jgi:DNA-binding PadR family transcriptional regulator